MLSRLWGKDTAEPDAIDHSIPQIAVIDPDCWVKLDSEAAGNDDDEPPQWMDGLDKSEVRRHQRIEFPELRNKAGDDESQYVIVDGLLYSVYKPTPTSAVYPRLVLPSPYWATVIQRAHVEVGRSSLAKTLDRLREAYVWPGMKRDIRDEIDRCAVCHVHRQDVEHTRMGDMPIAKAPMQILSVDLCGPMATTPLGYRYIDHATGWVESVPLKDKRCASIQNAFAEQIVARRLSLATMGRNLRQRPWSNTSVTLALTIGGRLRITQNQMEKSSDSIRP